MSSPASNYILSYPNDILPGSETFYRWAAKYGTNTPTNLATRLAYALAYWIEIDYWGIT